MTFITSPNQRKVTIHKCDRRKNYSKLDVEANKTAMRKLGYSAYMLYMYFCMNATAFDLILSKAALCAETSLTKNVSTPLLKNLWRRAILCVKKVHNACLTFMKIPQQTPPIQKPGASTPKSGKVPTKNR